MTASIEIFCALFLCNYNVIRVIMVIMLYNIKLRYGQVWMRSGSFITGRPMGSFFVVPGCDPPGPVYVIRILKVINKLLTICV